MSVFLDHAEYWLSRAEAARVDLAVRQDFLLRAQISLAKHQVLQERIQLASGSPTEFDVEHEDGCAHLEHINSACTCGAVSRAQESAHRSPDMGGPEQNPPTVRRDEG